MNPRIRLLAEQAGIELPDSSVYNGHIYRNSLERLAIMIVRECIDCARGAGLADDVAVRNGLGFNDGISEAVTHIKKHFGVEE